MHHLEIILCIMPSTSSILQPPTSSTTELALKGEAGCCVALFANTISRQRNAYGGLSKC